jgi:acyl-coenzyme A thioesterase PaaI-like protein
MPESFHTRLMRWGFNLFPVFRRTGGRITYIANDLRQVHIKLPLNWKTKNYVGTIFGGSMYGAVDPIYMVMFIKLLGPDYAVWDKSAIIHYKRPGKSTLTAEFSIDAKELSAIKYKLQQQKGIDRTYQVELRDNANRVCASIEKTLHFKKK